MLRLFLVLFLPVLLLSQTAITQDDDYRRTIAPTDLYACPEFTCDRLMPYPGGAILTVEAIETGDDINGVAEWVQTTDPLFGHSGFVHIALTEEYSPEAWEIAPITPQATDRAREIYALGQEIGNNPASFSKVGDCQNVESFFLSAFDEPESYSLGNFDELQSTIDHFSQSWSRESAAVDNGFNVASVLSPLWADAELCNSDESPIACEYRLHQPSIVVISMETWWAGRPVSEYAEYLVEIIDFWASNGVVPILATKADNWEGDHSINRTIYEVAQAEDVPLWNFWRAVQSVPNNGLSEDDFHLTFARNFFDDPQRLQNGWPIRNLTALAAIDAVWRDLNGEG